MKALHIVVIAILLISMVVAISEEVNFAQLNDESANLAQRIEKMEAQLAAAKTKQGAHKVVLAQSEGLLDELKMLFLNLALKIVEAVS